MKWVFWLGFWWFVFFFCCSTADSISWAWYEVFHGVIKIQTLPEVYVPSEAVTLIFHGDSLGSKIFMKSFFTCARTMFTS